MSKNNWWKKFYFNHQKRNKKIIPPFQPKNYRHEPCSDADFIKQIRCYNSNIDTDTFQTD